MQQARRQRGPVRPAAPVATDGNNSDDEVYAAAAAADDGAEAEYDLNDNLVVNAGRKAMELLPSLDHDEIVYDEFVKDFYKEPQALEALSPAEVCICEPPHHARPCPPKVCALCLQTLQACPNRGAQTL